MHTDIDGREKPSGIQDPDGLSCDVSLGLLLRGDIRQIQAWLTEIEPSLDRANVRLVYKLVYPGRLRIKREPIDDSDSERGPLGQV